jgi:hypothetical protein
MFAVDPSGANDFYKNVTVPQIREYLVSLRRRIENGKEVKNSESIQATRWSAINTFYSFLVMDDYLDINPDKTRNLYNYVNDNYEFSGTITRFKTGTFDEVKEHALKMEQSNYTWDNLWQNGECLYVYIENGEMKYMVR